MKIYVKNDEYTFPELNALFKIQYGIDLIFINFYYWRELILLSPKNRKAIPYRFELRNARNYFWDGISYLCNDKYFIEMHTAVFKRRILQERYSFKITLFDKISRNCFKRHPDIKHNFWLIIKTGWDYLYFTFTRWILLVQLKSGKDGIPVYNYKVRLNHNIFLNVISYQLSPADLLNAYDVKKRRRKLLSDLKGRNL